MSLKKAHWMDSKPIPPILGKIIEKKKLEIKELTLSGTPEKCIKSLKSTLKNKQKSIIAECKKASPSAGIIREDYDPVSIARIYEDCGAGAISVLTDKDFFHGEIFHLKKVAEEVSIPVLRKDFIISPKQIDEARLFGGSAILLIVRILSFNQLSELLRHSESLGMDVLVETHSMEEAKIAIDAGAEIIGINTRDLDTFSMNPGLIREIANNLPDTVVKVSESGVKNRQDYLYMTENTDAALIGTYFMKSKNIRAAFQELLKN